MRFRVPLLLLTTSCAGAVAPGSSSSTTFQSEAGGTGSDAGAGADSTVGGDAGGAADSTGTDAASVPSGSKCGSTPTQLVSFTTLAADTGASDANQVLLAVDSTHVYFAYGSALMSVPLRGGPVAMLARLPNDGRPVVTSDGVVLAVWTGGADDDYAILSVPLAGGSVQTLASAPGVSGFGVDDKTAYFIDAEGTKRVPLAGGEVTVVTTQVTSDSARDLAVVGGNLVAVTGTPGDASIESIPIDGGPPAAIATDLPNAGFPQACGADICWWTAPMPSGVGPYGASGGPGGVARLVPDGGITTVPIATPPNAPYIAYDFLFDGTDFFEGALPGGIGGALAGPLLRFPASGAPVVTMAPGVAGVAVDDTCVYYSDFTGIYSVVKTYALDGGVSFDE